MSKTLFTAAKTANPWRAAAAALPTPPARHAAGPSAAGAGFARRSSYARTTFSATAPLPMQARRLHTSAPARKDTTSEFPDFTPYRKDVSQDTSRAFSYFMIGSLGIATTVGTKNLLTAYLKNFSASADVLALAKVEVDLASIPEGKNLVLTWQGKPIFIRHRTAGEIAEANKVNVGELRHKEADSERVKTPEWLIMIGLCTHLGCVPIGEAGDYHGWFCPCHGSHYDISGRIRKGPAPLNLEIPPYEFIEDGAKVVIG